MLRGAGLALADVVKTTVYLADMADFAAMNEVYAHALRRGPAGPHHRRRGGAAQGRAGSRSRPWPWAASSEGAGATGRTDVSERRRIEIRLTAQVACSG